MQNRDVLGRAGAVSGLGCWGGWGGGGARAGLSFEDYSAGRVHPAYELVHLLMSESTNESPTPRSSSQRAQLARILSSRAV